MFGFDRDEYGSEDRFYERIPLFRRAFRRFPLIRYYLWWIVHNCVAHPLIGIVPVRLFFSFHDWTSAKMHPAQPTASRERNVNVAGT